jgi:hypothetical protein
MNTPLRLLWSLSLGACLTASGQATAKKAEAATGTVAGQVSCSDTNAPARFAVVTLQPVPGVQSDEDKKHEQAMNATATTDLEGRFFLDKVSVGRYYVVGSLVGYLNPLARFDQEQLQKMTEETRKELAKAVPIVDVEPNQAASVTLRLEHASELSGTVLYDDGSPAVGLQMQLLRKDKDGKLAELNMAAVNGLGLFGSTASTDDRGRYRMIGTPAGEYVVRASLPTQKISLGGLFGGGLSYSVSGEQGAGLSIYFGDTFRKRDAKVTKVGEGEQVGGLDITVPVAGLHTVRGTVTAKRDGHALNRGQVDLLYADDREAVRSVQVDSEGNFALTYVPEDRYILQLKGAGDGEEVEIHPYPDMTVRQNKVVRNYGDAEMPLIVQGDVSGVELAAPDAAAEKVASE